MGESDRSGADRAALVPTFWPHPDPSRTRYPCVESSPTSATSPRCSLLLEGLKRLEYRGYDSAGVALMNGGMRVVKSVGRVRVLEEKLADMEDSRRVSSEWPTRDGRPTVNPAIATPTRTPMRACACGIATSVHGIALIHNGIIENYVALAHLSRGEGPHLPVLRPTPRS